MAEGAQGKPKICPICDAPVTPGARNCASCGTDLTLFDVGMDTPGVNIGSKDNVDKILLELEKGEKDKAFAAMKDIGAEGGAPKPMTDMKGSQVIEVFQCPECGADVPTTSDTCPKCGVMFAPADMFQCPLCQAIIDANTTVCPGCGAVFESAEAPSPPPAAPAEKKPEPPKQAAPEKKPEAPKPAPPKAEPVKTPAPVEQTPVSFVERMKALRAQKEGGPAPQARPAPSGEPPRPGATQQPQKPAAPAPKPAQSGDAMKSLPQMVAKIKDDFALAKRLNIDITHAKELINQAVASGRDKNLKGAVVLVSQGEAEVEKVFTSYITKELVSMEKQARDVQSGGVDTSLIMLQLSKGRAFSAERKWGESISALDAARSALNTSASEYFEAQKGLSSIKSVVDDAIALRIDLGEGRTLYEDCLKATVRKDWDTAKMLAEQCNEHFGKVLPGYIANEMRKAKTKLLEVKMMNVSITKPVGYLKDANVAIKNNDYGSALHSIRLFQDAMAEVDRNKGA